MVEAGDQRSQPHVLVVDDDEIVRGMAREYLEQAGFLVAEAEDGEKALPALERMRPDIVLLDVMMPKVDGFETCAAIRHSSNGGTIPVLMMTGLDDIDSIHRAYEVGATDFITKPINWAILVERVRYICRATQVMNEHKALQDQLLQAQKLEAVATLAGGIAHDFANLLQTIQGYAELLLMSKTEDDSGRAELEVVCSASKRGGELTRQLLAYSRKLESRRQHIDLNQEVSRVRDFLKRTIPKMIEIELQLEDDLKCVHADPVQLDQVLMNQAVNARDAMPDGGKLVIATQNVALDEDHCKRHLGAIPGEYVLLSVSDTGHGMDEKTLERIFEPFFSTKAPGKGTGLGLSMVYGIIKNHEGHISCSSKPGKGTVFKIYLPAAEPVCESSEAEEVEPVKSGTETILHVDDEEHILVFCKQCLEKAGYTVLTAIDGESALELYRQKQGQIDLIMLDIIMPGIGGKKCLEELLKENPQAKILIASGHDPDEPTRKTLDAGAKGIVSKPFDVRRLLHVVREVLDGE